MRSHRLVAIASVVTVVCCMLIATPSGAARHKDRARRVTSHASHERCWKSHPAEKGFARRINTARASLGQGRLHLDRDLSKAARVHTLEMARRSELYHTPSHLLTRRVTNWVILGENVGVGGDVGSLHRAFMNSAPHRANVVHTGYRHVGIGTFHRHGRLWVTVIFEGITNPGTPLRVARCRA